jgi:bleomycin hydrolase
MPCSRESLGLELTPADQFQTGRCWLFAMMNTIRMPLIQRLGLPPTFELSQSYMMFWDKVERSNFFLETMIETAADPLEGRLVQFLLSNPIQDAGQWDMACSLVQKYGVCPKEHFPESQSTHESRRMNDIIANKLREYQGETDTGFRGFT